MTRCCERYSSQNEGCAWLRGWRFQDVDIRGRESRTVIGQRLPLQMNKLIDNNFSLSGGVNSKAEVKTETGGGAGGGGQMLGGERLRKLLSGWEITVVL